MTFEQTPEDGVCPEETVGGGAFRATAGQWEWVGFWEGESKYVSEQDRKGVRVQIIESLLAAVRTLDFTLGGYEIIGGSVQSRGVT